MIPKGTNTWVSAFQVAGPRAHWKYTPLWNNIQSLGRHHSCLTTARRHELVRSNSSHKRIPGRNEYVHFVRCCSGNSSRLVWHIWTNVLPSVQFQISEVVEEVKLGEVKVVADNNACKLNWNLTLWRLIITKRKYYGTIYDIMEGKSGSVSLQVTFQR